MRKWTIEKIGAIWSFLLKTKSSFKLSLGEYGRQRTSTKFHDLVLNLKFQNSRVLETRLFLALFSRRKVSVDDWIILTNIIFLYLTEFIRFKKVQYYIWQKIICMHFKRSESSGFFVLHESDSYLRIVSVFHRIL